MQVAVQMAQAVAKSRAELQVDRKGTKKAERERLAAETAESQRKADEEAIAKQQEEAAQRQAKEYAFECNSHEYSLRCSPPFVAGKGS